ncbi:MULTISPECIES: SurA N-terminal domain-containing protein [Legionella]|uniref:Periplasmic chaperone PpiD n=1 Tax=Legionella maceachernii TaxID=466 RepID=A0A0W0VX33_9GAMM|nr:SurA N-terminal domain-containing protein [Legionella maceachernii]KTD24505.1 peptidyl-prolyl cis-trans isomerase D [Legionella maceachernii]SJZ60853.1 peptidyl-prolyl cis-trans isomerase D [Legionella maceachernii]SUP00874.1 Peptidyl-prolyl cis-trans isomerase D [Legionella maceachernii]
MLQKLNERIQGIIAWVVIILIAITFTLFGVDYYMQGHQASDVEVDVNGHAISKQAFDMSYRRIRQQRDPSQMTAASESALKKQVLTAMITNEVSVQAAKKAGFAVGNQQADAAILSIPQFQQDGHFSPERYQQALSGAMFTPESFRNEVKQGMLLNQQRFAFIGTAFALPNEIKRFVKLYMQTRDYEYLEIPASLFIKNNSISDAAINNYYQHHQKAFLSPETVSIDYVRLSTQQIKDKIQITPEEINAYYEENKTNFLTPAQWQVAHILFAVPEDASDEAQNQIKQKADEAYQVLQRNPEQFNEYVKTKSDDKLSIANNGLLPWLVAGQSGFDKSLANLTQPGQISSPVQSPHGYEIFKLIAYKPATIKPLTEVESSIKEQLLVDRAQTQYAQALEQLSDLSYQSPDSLTPVADALKLPIEHTEPFSRQGGSSELTKNKQVVNAAFSHDVLNLGNNSDPIQVDNDSVVVLRVNQHFPAAEKPLVEVKDSIAKKLALMNAEQQAKQLGTELLSDKEDESQQVKLMQTNQLQWRAVEKATRDTDKADPAINDLAFSLPKINSRDGRGLNNGNYVIVRLKQINDGQLESLDKEQQASIAQQIEASYGVMDYDLYINNLIQTAKIEKPK